MCFPPPPVASGARIDMPSMTLVAVELLLFARHTNTHTHTNDIVKVQAHGGGRAGNVLVRVVAPQHSVRTWKNFSLFSTRCRFSRRRSWGLYAIDRKGQLREVKASSPQRLLDLHQVGAIEAINARAGSRPPSFARRSGRSIGVNGARRGMRRTHRHACGSLCRYPWPTSAPRQPSPPHTFVGRTTATRT